jgi:hypothetical protein
MGLVAAIALECGVDSLGDEGKVAWFSVGDPPDVPSEELAAAWALDEGSPQDEIAETAPITLASMPATLWLAARQHHDALLRELVLHLVEHPRDDVDLAAADVARSIVSSAVVRAVEARRRQVRRDPWSPPVTRAPSPGHPAPSRSSSTCPSASPPGTPPCRTCSTWRRPWRPRASCSPGPACRRSSPCGTGRASR